MDWQGSRSDSLSFRQMALLSGMSEASLRTMANPKRKNALPTHADGRTAFIKPREAKAWLISKGRYLPLVSMDRRGEQLDFSLQPHQTLEDFLLKFDQRLHYLLGTDDRDSVTQALNSIHPKLLTRRLFDDALVLNLDAPEQLEDEEFMKAVSIALQPSSRTRLAEGGPSDGLDAARQLEARLNQALSAPSA